MSDLYAFDCDGTLEVAGGIVRLDTLRHLRDKLDCIIVIVSPSGACADLGFERIISQPSRLGNLHEARRRHPSCEQRFYVSDNPSDDKVAEAAGYRYIHPNSFYAKVK